MPKSKLFKRDSMSVIDREMIYQYYLSKYFSLWLNKFKFVGDIDYQQKDFIMRKFWIDGQIACFKLKGSETEAHPQGMLVFTPFAPNGWNIYDWPTSVNLINTKGVSFIPVGPQLLDKDVVIGYAQRNKKSIFALIEPIIQKITDVEMVIKINLQVAKMPWLAVVTPETEARMKVIMDKLRSDDPEFFVSSDEANMLKALVSGAPYIIDKLYNYKSALENEAREYIGINNMGMNEKKEHLITAEVNVNNDIVEYSDDIFIDCMDEFWERVQNVFGISIRIELNQNEEVAPDEESDEEKEIQDNEA